MKNIYTTVFIAIIYIAQTAFSLPVTPSAESKIEREAEATLKQQILKEATWALQQQPVTVTASSSPRSAGGKHDFFSEADYFGLILKIPTVLILIATV
jgi:hypothetical protein